MNAKRSPTYEGYSAGTPHDEARRLFAMKHGHLPVKVFDAPNNVLAGPVGVKPKKDETK